MATLAEIETAALALKPEEREHLENVLRDMRILDERNFDLEEIYKRTGVVPLPRKSGAIAVTDEDVRRIREEEGI